MSEITVITNNVPRFTIEAHELSADERAEFDYLEWRLIDAGEESAEFFRYRGELYDLGEFMRAPDMFRNWDGYISETFFSGILVRYNVEDESVVCGRYYS